MNRQEEKEKRKWIQEQFDKGRPKGQYRDVLLHASLIESIVRYKVKVHIENAYKNLSVKKSGKDCKREFDPANRWLYIHKKIDKNDFDLLEKIRNTRNELVHGIFGETMTVGSINRSIKRLRADILKAYKCPFLEGELKNKYGVTRLLQ
jgi:uncharacterized protein YutE (UPF0331/DUF86 family)